MDCFIVEEHQAWGIHHFKGSKQENETLSQLSGLLAAI